MSLMERFPKCPLWRGSPSVPYGEVPQVSLIGRFPKCPLYRGSPSVPYTEVPQVSLIQRSQSVPYMEVPLSFIFFIHTLHQIGSMKSEKGDSIDAVFKIALVQFHTAIVSDLSLKVQVRTYIRMYLCQ